MAMTRKSLSDWDIDRAQGEEAEGLVRALRHGILVGTVEVKRDRKAWQTGNIAIEYACKAADGWQPSGIAVTRSTTWAVVCWPVVIAAPTWLVRIVARQYREAGRTRDCDPFGTHPTRSVVVPLGEFICDLVAATRDGMEEEERSAA